MHVWSGVVIAGAALLVINGPPKLRNPAPTINALRSVGATWVGPVTVRALAVVEIVGGGFAGIVGGRWGAGAIALIYLGFSGFLLRALRTPSASCGCTARDDTPPTVGHLLMTVVFAAGGIAATVADTTGVVDISRSGPGLQIAVAFGFAAIVTWLAWSILTLPILSLPRQIPSPRRT
jgi:hypothetical protein